jgi:hypothetical protein
MKKITQQSTKAKPSDTASLDKAAAARGNFKPSPAADLTAQTVARHGLINKADSKAQAANKPTDRPKLHFSTTPELQRGAKGKGSTVEPIPDTVNRP